MMALSESDRARLLSLPRYQRGTATLFGRTIHYVDAASLVSTIDAVFGEDVYRFESKEARPSILDCGANIGISVLYFKTLFPDCEITAFEPDPAVAATLERNILEWGFSEVTVVKKALWSEETELEFWAEGADGGRLNEIFDARGSIRVPTTKLSRYLTRRVDFLKLDIEGAEADVIAEAAPALNLVDRMYIEYHSFANQPQKLPTILNVLSSASMRYYIREHGRIVSNPFLRPSSYLNLDMLLHVFAVRAAR